MFPVKQKGLKAPSFNTSPPKPPTTHMPLHDKLMAFLDGGTVPGKAQVPGNSAKNDTVLAKLSPGEVVVPRSITQSEDAPDKAKRFMKLHAYFAGGK